MRKCFEGGRKQEKEKIKMKWNIKNDNNMIVLGVGLM